MVPRLYRALSAPLGPFAELYLRRRSRRGKEDPMRLRERCGIAGRARPPGPLVWVHAASVGEATATLALIARLLETRPGLEILVTTGTIASARLLERVLPARTRHQFVPFDLSRWVERFLDHWRPDLAIWVESELWPNLVLMTAARKIPMVLVNGRMSGGSYRRWQRLPRLIGPMLGSFALCLTQDGKQTQRFSHLGAQHASSVGDLKSAAAPLPADPVALATLRREIGSRPRWVAASTHHGEEEIAAAVHRLLAVAYPGLLTIIAPRHPARAETIGQMLAGRGLRTARRSRGEPIGPATEIYLADTMGELGLFYRLAGVALIGGSLSGHGGHNPLEAARLGCAVLLGPDTRNCAAVAAALRAAGAADTVVDAKGLADAVAALFADRELCARRAKAGVCAAANGLGVLDAVIGLLAPFLDRLVPEAAGGRDCAVEPPSRLRA